MSRLKLLSVVALVGGPILSYAIHKEVEERKLVEKDGVTVPGVIMDGDVRTKRGSKNYKFNVSYPAQDANPTTKKFSVPKAFAERYVSDQTLIRDDVEVRYLPGDPQKAFLIGGNKPIPGMVYVGYGLAAVGAVGTYFSFRPKKATMSGPTPT